MTKNFVDVNGNSIELEMKVDTATPGLMSNEDKAKLDGIEAGANKYVQPTSFPATMITEDTGHKFITDAERTAWNAKAANIIATTTVNGLMAATDKAKLDGIATGANAYTHPNTSGNKHIPSGGSSGQILRWSSDGTAAWGADNNTTYSVATTTANGLMSAADKIKLDGSVSYTYGTYNTSHYKKYEDGTLEMWGRLPLVYYNQLWANNTLGSSGFSVSVPFTITLPVTTVGHFVCNINIESTDTTWASIYSYTTTTVNYVLITPTPSKQYYAYIHWSVKGKWK